MEFKWHRNVIQAALKWISMIHLIFCLVSEVISILKLTGLIIHTSRLMFINWIQSGHLKYIHLSNCKIVHFSRHRLYIKILNRPCQIRYAYKIKANSKSRKIWRRPIFLLISSLLSHAIIELIINYANHNKILTNIYKITFLV